MGKKSKYSYRYDCVNRGGIKVVMTSRKSIALKYNQLMSGHALTAQYLRRIGIRSDMKCWCCGVRARMPAFSLIGIHMVFIVIGLQTWMRVIGDDELVRLSGEI